MENLTLKILELENLISELEKRIKRNFETLQKQIDELKEKVAN